jgi:hypothetical protein
MHLEKGFSKEVDDFQDGLLRAGIQGEEVYDQVMDFSSSLADEYILLTDGMYSAVLVSMYHLWEHDIRDLCKHKPVLSATILMDGDEPLTDQKIQGYKYEKLKSLLMFWGVQEPIFNQVNLLRLVANTAKHGSGPSATELLSVNKRYYCKLALLRDLEISDAGLSYNEIEPLTVDDIKYFASVLSAFWVELGKQVNI